MPHLQQRNAEMEACIDACLACYRECQGNAMQHCLELGGRHVEPAHFRLLVECAESCRSTAASMLTGSQFQMVSCELCAEICRACAESCRAVGDMEDCAAACERCARSCEEMAASAGRGGKPTAGRHGEHRAQ